MSNILHIVNIVKNIPDAIISIDLKGRVTFWNNAAEELFGYKFREVGNKTIPLFNEETMYELDAILKKVRSDESVVFRTQKCGKDNSQLNLLITASPLYEEEVLIGAAILAQRAATIQKATTLPYGLNHYMRDAKRTFIEIRKLILLNLAGGKLTINQLANKTGINWKTVEKHLTYLIGKKYVDEIFSSEYVRIFELTELGKNVASEIQKDKLSNVIRLKNEIPN